MQIREISTKIVVKASPEKLQKLFPHVTQEKHAKVIYGGKELEEFIFTCETKAYRLLKRLSEIVPGFQLSEFEEKTAAGNLIRICDELGVVRKIGEDTSEIDFSSYSDNEEEHYRSIEKIKEAIQKCDVEVIDGKCDVVIVKRC